MGGWSKGASRRVERGVSRDGIKVEEGVWVRVGHGRMGEKCAGGEGRKEKSAWERGRVGEGCVRRIC